jgi:hypothetical protein
MPRRPVVRASALADTIVSALQRLYDEEGKAVLFRVIQQALGRPSEETPHDDDRLVEWRSPFEERVIRAFHKLEREEGRAAVIGVLEETLSQLRGKHSTRATDAAPRSRRAERRRIRLHRALDRLIQRRRTQSG